MCIISYRPITIFQAPFFWFKSIPFHCSQISVCHHSVLLFFAALWIPDFKDLLKVIIKEGNTGIFPQ